jgi:DUF1680 family protein
MLRIPAWAAETTPVFVNGAGAARGKAGSYIKIRRDWKTGDTVRLILPFTLRTEEYTGFDQSETNQPRYAVFHGPVLLALTGGFDEKDIPRLPFAACDAGKFLVSRGKGCFEVKGRPFFEFKPYYEVQDELFTCFPVFDWKAGVHTPQLAVERYNLERAF